MISWMHFSVWTHFIVHRVREILNFIMYMHHYSIMQSIMLFGFMYHYHVTKPCLESISFLWIEWWYVMYFNKNKTLEYKYKTKNISIIMGYHYKRNYNLCDICIYYNLYLLCQKHIYVYIWVIVCSNKSFQIKRLYG